MDDVKPLPHEAPASEAITATVSIVKLEGEKSGFEFAMPVKQNS